MPAGWIDNDALWSALEHQFDSPEAWMQATRDVDALVELLDLPDEARIADLASGTGRMAIDLARRGYSVTAVERPPAFVNLLTKKARTLSTDLEIVRRDIREFERKNTFDLQLLWGDSFGYFDSRAQDAAFLERCARSLRDDGRLVLAVTPKEGAEARWPLRTWSAMPGSRLLLEENLIIRGFSAIRHTWIVVDGADRKSFSATRRLYSAAELESALYEAGFDEVECFADLAGAPFGRGSRFLLAIATK
jgi:SAM-dependent methyltransferase